MKRIGAFMVFVGCAMMFSPAWLWMYGVAVTADVAVCVVGLSTYCVWLGVEVIGR